MADQSELDLGLPAPTRAQRKRPSFAGFTPMQLAMAVFVLGALVWGMWVTKLLLAPTQDRIVSARLSAIVGDYVQAQARSASPPAQVEAEMRRFMASLDHELQSRSAGGQIVLVGEAVLTKNVPDITDSLAKAVYASGVPRPRQASAEDLQRLQNQAMIAAQGQAAAMGPAPMIDPMAAAGGTGPAIAPQAMPAPGPVPSAPVTFGGQDGAGVQ